MHTEYRQFIHTTNYDATSTCETGQTG